ncbi:ferrous iron transport protein A [Patescibacteria group bacterium]|nr:ferrous iron transport protein A [Patescibacteria group bacterium]
MDSVSLIILKEGQEAKIVSIMGGRTASKRLADLGLTPGTLLRVVRKAPLSGPVIVEVRGSRLILGRGLASKVFVKNELPRSRT